MTPVAHRYKSNEEYVYVRGRGRGKYVCEECGIRCKKPSMLKKHIRTHTDVRPYVCKYCNFAFKTKGKRQSAPSSSTQCIDFMGCLQREGNAFPGLENPMRQREGDEGIQNGLELPNRASPESDARPESPPSSWCFLKEKIGSAALLPGICEQNHPRMRTSCWVPGRAPGDWDWVALYARALEIDICAAHLHPWQLHATSAFSISYEQTFSLKTSIPGHLVISDPQPHCLQLFFTSSLHHCLRPCASRTCQEHA